MTSRQAPAPDQATPVADATTHEAPALQLERDVPSDGQDEIGEAMIRDLPKNPELAKPPGKTDTSDTSSTPD